MHTISMIAAMDKNRVIGSDNDLPWYISSDLKYFKEQTLGKPVILGRKTFQSFGERPLPDRPHIVITRDTSYQKDGVTIVHTIEDAITAAKQFTNGEIMVIGGGEIYKQSLPLCDKIYLTEVDTEAKGDVYFPNFSHQEFKETSRKSSNENGFTFDWVIYQRA